MTNLLPNPRLLSSTQAWSAGGINLSVSRWVVIVDRRVPGLASYECILRRKMWSEEPKNSRLKESDYDVIDLFGSDADAHFLSQVANPTVKLTRGLQLQFWSRESVFFLPPSRCHSFIIPHGAGCYAISHLFFRPGQLRTYPAHGLP